MAKDKKAETILDAVLEAARKPGRRSSHSPVYEWLWAHHDRLVGELSAPRSPNWQEVAAALGKLGVLDATGKPPATSTVRNAWWRVCRDKAAGPKARKPRGRQVAPRESAEPPAPQPKRRTASQDDTELPDDFFAKPRYT